MHDASFRHGDVLSIAAVAVLAEHLRLHAELLVAAVALLALAARHQVVQTHAVAGFDPSHLGADGLDHAGDFVTQRLRQRAGGRSPCPVMRVRVADARGLDLHQHLARADGRHGDLLQRQRLTDGGHANSFHGLRLLL